MVSSVLTIAHIHDIMSCCMVFFVLVHKCTWVLNLLKLPHLIWRLVTKVLIPFSSSDFQQTGCWSWGACVCTLRHWSSGSGLIILMSDCVYHSSKKETREQVGWYLSMSVFRMHWWQNKLKFCQLNFSAGGQNHLKHLLAISHPWLVDANNIQVGYVLIFDGVKWSVR